MKKKIAAFVSSLGGTTQYSGRRRTMFVHAFNKADILDEVIKKFGRHLPIRVV